MPGLGWMLGLAVAMTSLAPLAAAQESEPPAWESWGDWTSMARVGGQYGSYLTSSYCLDGCRYDRSSVDPGRGGQRFIRIESTREGPQGVIFEQPGAGAITRIWMTTGDGISTDLSSNVRLRVYLDGENNASIDMPLADYFDQPEGTRADRSQSPVALQNNRHTASGGNVSYRPLVWRDGIRIALLHGAEQRLWYQINHLQFANAAAALAYDAQTSERDLAWTLAGPWVDSLLIGKNRPITRGRRMEPRLVSPEVDRIDTLSPTQPRRVIWNREGAGWIRGVRLLVERARWNDVDIALTFDGEQTVQLPLAEFFTADALDRRSPRGLFAGVDGAGALYSKLPMPYRHTASIALSLRDGADPSPLEVRSHVVVDDTPPPADAAPLHAHRHVACPTTPPASGDEILLAHQGAGRMIGLALWMSGDGLLPGGYYLEGDERLHIDGSVQPLWYGTGVEDLFNGGFYFDRGEFIHPLAGATLVHDGTTDHTASMYRWFLADAPRWRHSFQFRMENGAYGTQPMCLRSVAFFHGRAQATQQVLAALQVGDLASEAAADYRRAGDARCSASSGLFGDEPPTAHTALVCWHRASSRFTLRAAEPATAFRLRRTFDASVAGQAADVIINGHKVGAWSGQQASPARRWSQLDVDFVLPAPATELAVEIRPANGASISESRYELWGAAPASADFRPDPRSQVTRVHPQPAASEATWRATDTALRATQTAPSGKNAACDVEVSGSTKGPDFAPLVVPRPMGS